MTSSNTSTPARGPATSAGQSVLYAHRGYSAVAPENTIPAMEAALQAGAAGIELDVQATKEHQLIVLHDDELARTTNGVGIAVEQSIDYLQTLDAGAWFNKQFAGITVPTLAETMAYLAASPHPAIDVFIELKAGPFWDRTALQALVALWEQHEAYNDGHHRYVFCSFDGELINRLARYQPRRAPPLPLGYHLGQDTDVNAQLADAKRQRAQYVLPDYRLLLKDPQLVHRCHKLKLNIVTWTVDDPAIAELLRRQGVTKIISNTLLQ